MEFVRQGDEVVFQVKFKTSNRRPLALPQTGAAIRCLEIGEAIDLRERFLYVFI